MFEICCHGTFVDFVMIHHPRNTEPKNSHFPIYFVPFTVVPLMLLKVTGSHQDILSNFKASFKN